MTQEKTTCLSLEQYKEQFDTYYNRAKLLPKSCTSFERFQEQLSGIGFEAGNCYRFNKNADQEDYPLRVNIFLEFDEYLKQLKREFQLSIGKKTSSCRFYFKKNSTPSEKEHERIKSNLHF